jgi:hypothetical protein
VFEATDIREWRGHDVVDIDECLGGGIVAALDLG